MKMRPKMKVGDLVTHANAWETARGIILEFYHLSEYTKVYWFSHKTCGSHPVEDLEVISEGR
tara:strand:+ start:539 stop:724 length:186 start_codon:yes stop_codon:yes gene_type:complete